MTQCAFLLEVVVGELTLTHHHHHHHHASPTVRIQVGGAPPLLVPFLAPAFSSTFGHALDQPGTEDGRFVFQCGKSSIFSAPRQLLGGGGGAKVKVEVLGAGGGQAALLGRCDALMVPQGEASTRLGRRGKLALVGGEGKVVGRLSLSLSLRCLGEEVRNALGLTVGDWRSCKTSRIPSTYEESFSVLQDGHAPSPHSTAPYHDLPPSEKIALRIASLEDPIEAALGEWQPVQHPREERGVDLTQPPPIIYLGPDEEGERLWNEKMAKMEHEEVAETQKHHQGGISSDKIAKGMEDSQHTSQGSHRSARDNSERSTHRKKRRRKTKNPLNPPKNIHPQIMKQHHPPPPLARPQGWLRSTPPAPRASTHPPRLNRSHLLRLAASDPQLGQNLKAEVERRVRSRVRDLEEEFLEQVEKLAAKRRNQKVNHHSAATPNTSYRQLETVGCQTENAEVTKQVPEGSKLDKETLPSSQSSSPQYHRMSSPQPSLIPHAPQHTTTTKTKCTQTEATKNTATDSPKELKRERETGKHKAKETKKESETGLLSIGPRGTSEGRGSSSRILLGEMPKNLTYVIGSDGERVYAEGYEVLPKEEEDEEEGERLGGGTEDKQREKREGIMITEKDNNKSGKNHYPNTSSSSSSKPQRHKTAPASAPRDGSSPRLLQPHHYQGEKELPPREPSQDTWGLTYTIKAAEHHPSTSTQQESTPSTRLSTPYTDSGGGCGDGGSGGSESWESSEVEEEEVEEEVEEEGPSASSLSNEVCREIFKGRKADILSGMASSPVQSVGESLLSPSVSEADPDQDRVGYRYSSPALSPSPHILKRKNEERIKRKNKQLEERQSPKTNIFHHNFYEHSDLGSTKDSIQGPSKPSASPKGQSNSNSGSSGSSISDISARIAALLVAKKINVPRVNTDSVSSYVPSQQPSTLSSMSDVLMSPSSSFSG